MGGQRECRTPSSTLAGGAKFYLGLVGGEANIELQVLCGWSRARGARACGPEACADTQEQASVLEHSRKKSSCGQLQPQTVAESNHKTTTHTRYQIPDTSCRTGRGGGAGGGGAAELTTNRSPRCALPNSFRFSLLSSLFFSLSLSLSSLSVPLSPFLVPHPLPGA